MAGLTSKTLVATYKGLLKTAGDNVAIPTGSTAVNIVDGEENTSALWLTDGEVGIGTNTPVSQISGVTLHIDDSSSNPANINLTGGGGADTNDIGYIAFSDPDDHDDNLVRITGQVDGSDAGDPGGLLIFSTQENGGALAPHMAIIHNGYVGIGTTSPTNIVQIEGADPRLVIKDTDSYESGVSGPKIQFEGLDSGPTNRDLAVIHATSTTVGEGQLRFSTRVDGSQATALTIDHNSYVGIGTTTPAVSLHIANTVVPYPYLYLERTDDDDGTIEGEIIGGVAFVNSSAVGGDPDICAVIQAKAGSAFGTDDDQKPTDLQFFTQDESTDSTLGSPRMTIDMNGKVGIGTTAPGYKLHIQEDRTGEYAANIANLHDAGKGLLIFAGPNTLSSAGDGAWIDFQDGNGSPMGGIRNSSNVDLPEPYEASDARIKEDIADTKVNALNILSSLKLREFQKKHQANKCKIGLVAQEVLDVLPELVAKTSAIGNQWEELLDDSLVDDAGNKQMYTIGTGILPYYFIKAIQELSAKVEALENNNNQGDSSNEQEQDRSGGDSSSESSGEDSGGTEGNSSDSSSSTSGASEASESSSDDGGESSGSSGSDTSDDS